jgi:hypothetical protein
MKKLSKRLSEDEFDRLFDSASDKLEDYGKHIKGGPYIGVGGSRRMLGDIIANDTEFKAVVYKAVDIAKEKGYPIDTIYRACRQSRV